MKKAVKTITVFHKDFGNVKIKVDAEDAYLFDREGVYIKQDGENPARVIFMDQTKDRRQELSYASRVILAEHDALTETKNVFFRNKDSFDLRKSNLFQI